MHDSSDSSDTDVGICYHMCGLQSHWGHCSARSGVGSRRVGHPRFSEPCLEMKVDIVPTCTRGSDDLASGA